MIRADKSFPKDFSVCKVPNKRTLLLKALNKLKLPQMTSKNDLKQTSKKTSKCPQEDLKLPQMISKNDLKQSSNKPQKRPQNGLKKTSN